MHARQPMHDVAVQIDDAVAPLEERVGRADAHARRFVALIAQNREEEPLRVRERALLDRLDPAAVDADRDVVLGLARDRARVAADAFPQIDGEPVIRHERIRRLYRIAPHTQRGRHPVRQLFWDEWNSGNVIENVLQN